MTAATVNIAYDNTKTPEGAFRMDYLTGFYTGITHTPTNSSGKTIRVMGLNTTQGTAVKTTVSSGVITIGNDQWGSAFGATSDTHDGILFYTLT